MLYNESENVNYSLCIICQKRKSVKDETSKPGEQGLRTLEAATGERKSLSDDVNIKNISRISEAFRSGNESRILYHRPCYASFTSKDKILRLQKGGDHCSGTKESTQSSSARRRSDTGHMSWDRCIICQEDKKEMLHNVMTFNRNKKIIDLAKFDYKLGTRIANVTDLIATEAVYHSSCLIRLERTASRTKEEIGHSQVSELSFTGVCKELRQAAQHGKVGGILLVHPM